MMGQAVGFMMAIMGCGEGDASCEQVAVAPVRYESEAACMAASDAQVSRYADGDFPVVVAQCRRADAGPITLAANEVRLPEPRGPIQTASARR